MENNVYSKCCDPLCSSLLLLVSPSFEGSWKVGITTTKEGWNVNRLHREMGWGRHRDGNCMLCFHLRNLKFTTYQHTSSPVAGCSASPHAHLLCSSEVCIDDNAKVMLNTSKEEGRFELKYFKALRGVTRLPLLCFTTDWSSGCGAPDRNERMHWQSVGSAEWKTSDFVVTLIKEQQVPVCLSAQAVLSSPRRFQPAAALQIQICSHLNTGIVTAFSCLFSCNNV